jgi:IS5 family transposase
MRVAASAPQLRCEGPDCASAVHGVDRSWFVEVAAPSGSRRTGKPRHDRLVPGDAGWSIVAGEKGGSATGPNPVDRGKLGSKIHALSDRSGIPLAVGISAANTHDSAALKPLVLAIPAIRSRQGPRRFRPAKLHADKAYDIDELRAWLRNRGIVPRLARKSIESSTKLGRHRWIIERTIAWLFGYRRLTLRYERYGTLFCGFLTLAAALTCYKKLTK